MNTQLTLTVDGRLLGKGRRSGAGNDCAYVPVDDGPRDLVYDSKSAQTLHAPAGPLIAYLKTAS